MPVYTELVDCKLQASAARTEAPMDDPAIRGG